MAGRRPARRGGGGGDLVPSLADLRARLIRAVAPFALAAGLGVYPVLGTGKSSGFVALIAATALILLAVALVWRLGELIQMVLAGLAAAFAVLLYDGDPGFAGTAGYAAGLVLVAELAYAATEPAVSGRGLAVRARGASTVALAVAGAAVLALFLLAATDVSLSGTLALQAVGVAAAVLALALVVRLFALQRS